MSWGEVFKINKNMKRALNEQIRDLKCTPIRVISATTTYTPEKTGWYKVICVGKGADGYYLTPSATGYNGGGGGVAIKTLRLLSSATYDITVGTTASFSNILTATGATGGTGSGNSPTPSAGGTGSGGDYNFTGGNGTYTKTKDTHLRGCSVGVSITELSRQHHETNSYGHNLISGDCILNFGGGGTFIYDINNAMGEQNGFPAGVIIIPLEMEE